MIVRDEEKFIKRNLDNHVRYFNEIIILDTGSTDSTMSILKKYEKENCYLYLSISLADVYIIMKKCFRFVFRLLKKCESWKRKVLMQFLSVIDKKKGKKEAKMNFTI